MPVQHNPHSHSIPCAALGVTLDAFVARELESAPESCAGCQCSLQLEAPGAPDEGRVGAMNAYARLRPADEPNVVPVEKTKPDQSEADEATEAA